MPVERIGFMLQVCYFRTKQISHLTDCPVMPLVCVDVRYRHIGEVLIGQVSLDDVGFVNT